jgi:hypothetical protein
MRCVTPKLQRAFEQGPRPENYQFKYLMQPTLRLRQSSGSRRCNICRYCLRTRFGIDGKTVDKFANLCNGCGTGKVCGCGRSWR